MRKKLESRIAELTNSVFTAKVINSTLDAAEQRLMDCLADFPTNSVACLGTAIQNFRQRAVARLDRLGTNAAPPATFDRQNELRLTSWEPRVGNLQSPGQHELRQLPNGREILALRVNKPATLVQWRTAVVLAPGNYRFEGRARCRVIIAYPGARSRGAGLRTMLGSVENQLEGTADWTLLSHSFRMTELNQVDLCAELRAHAGEVEFDLASMKLVREP